MHGAHETREVSHPVWHGQGVLEVPLLLSSLHLAALERAAFRQGVTVGELLRRLIADYLPVLCELPRSGTGTRGSDRHPHTFRANEEAGKSSRPTRARADEVRYQHEANCE
jgi:hypothetical protein